MLRRTFLTAAAALPLAGRAVAQTEDAPIKLRELYEGRQLSALGEDLLGERITVEGYMAPPLKADSQFFVLTKMPMAVCPFCETSAEWPDDIVAIYTKRTVDVIPFNVGIDTTGILEWGEYRDPDTGFVSMLRLTDATYG
ncbi:hypothetical protein [Histidinibacterium aquaticum]|nr:hypothetical protein [Histidinibacterium aquaticum]